MAVTLYRQVGKGKARRYQKVNLGRGRRPTNLGACGIRSPTAPLDEWSARKIHLPDWFRKFAESAELRGLFGSKRLAPLVTSICLHLRQW